MILITLFAWTFWVWLAIAIIGITLFVEKTENIWPATFFLAVTIVALQLFSDLNPFAWIKNHPWEILFGALAYLPIGGLYSIPKWYFFLVDYIKEHQGWANYKPSVSGNKNRILTWIVYWPFSLIGLIIDKPITAIATGIYNLFTKTYSNILEKVWAKYGNQKSGEKIIP
jgi:hypothetical protein